MTVQPTSQDSLATLLAAVLFDLHPVWSAQASTGDGIRLAIPGPDGRLPLHVEATPDSITISYSGWHSRLGEFLGMEPQECVEEATWVIEGLLNENLVVVEATGMGAWCDASDRFRHTIEELAPASWRVQSWRGTHDMLGGE